MGWGRSAGTGGGTPPPAELVAAAGTLGLRWPRSAADAKAVYRRAVLRVYPDQGGMVEAFRRVQGLTTRSSSGVGCAFRFE